MFLKKTLCFAALALAVFNASAAALSIKDGLFMKDGKPFYGVGVNYFDGFARFVRTGNTSYRDGLKVLADNKIPFIRISTLAFWPKDITDTYVAHPDVFHRRLNEFMDEAERNHIGVILDVFFNWTAIAALENHEPIPFMGVKGSNTLKRMQAITRDIVQKHKDHKALWAWEFGNEASSFMDLTVALGYDNTPAEMKSNGLYLPSNPDFDEPVRDEADNFTPETITTAIKTFAATVRELDQTTPIMSGNNVPRENAYHMRYASYQNRFDKDSPEEFGKILAENDTDAVDTYSMHLYPYSEGHYFGGPSTIGDIIRAAMDRSKLEGSKRPFFLGEFGADEEQLGKAAAQEKFFVFTKEILDQKVQMSALWVYDYFFQDKNFNVTKDLRSYQLDELKRVNELMNAR